MQITQLQSQLTHQASHSKSEMRVIRVRTFGFTALFLLFSWTSTLEPLSGLILKMHLSLTKVKPVRYQQNNNVTK